MSRIQTTTQYEYANSETTYPHLDLIEGLNRRVRYTYKDGTRDNIPVNNQEKVISITENGTIEIIPESNYTGLSKVIATINVLGGGDCDDTEGTGLEILNLGEYRLKVDNNDITAKTRQIIVTDEGGHQDVCTLTSAAGDAYVTIAEGDIELDYLGTPVAVEVKSNTTWTIE